MPNCKIHIGLPPKATVKYDLVRPNTDFWSQKYRNYRRLLQKYRRYGQKYRRYRRIPSVILLFKKKVPKI